MNILCHSMIVCTANSITIKIKLEFMYICDRGNDFVCVSTILPLYIYQLFWGCGVFRYSFYQSNQKRSKTNFILNIYFFQYILNRIGSDNVLASSAVDHRFEPPLDQTKDDQIGMCCFLAKHAALRRNNKDWLARNQDNVSKLGTCLSADCCFSELAL